MPFSVLPRYVVMRNCAWACENLRRAVSVLRRSAMAFTIVHMPLRRTLRQCGWMTKKEVFYFWLVTLLALGVAWLDYASGAGEHLGIFYLLPIVAGAWWLGRAGGVFFAVGCTVLWLVADHYAGQTYASPALWYAHVAFRGLYALAGALVVSFFRKQLDLSATPFRLGEAQLRNLVSRTEAIRESERIRIAREIHDGLGQQLTGLKLDMALMLCADNAMNAVERRELGQRILTAIDGTIELVRTIASELRPCVLDTLGLVAAIEWQAAEFEKRTGIRCRCTMTQTPIALDHKRTTAVFRILQEILTNVLRHAHATELHILLRAADDWYCLEVRDNGRGIADHQQEDPNALGLLGMRERARQCSGDLRIMGQPGVGTTVIVWVPLGEAHCDSRVTGRRSLYCA